MGKEAGKIGHKGLGMDFILKEIGHLKENRKDLGLFASVLTIPWLLLPPPIFLSRFGAGGGRNGGCYFLCKVYETPYCSCPPFLAPCLSASQPVGNLLHLVRL